MPNTSERRLNIAWSLLLAIPAAGAIYKNLTMAENPLQLILGIAAVCTLFATLCWMATRFDKKLPKNFFDTSFGPFLLTYILTTAGYWNSGLSLVNLTLPVIVYFFFAGSDRLQKWAKSRGDQSQ